MQFSFDYNAAYPVAKAVLQEDDNLQKMRFELVPKQYVFSNVHSRNFAADVEIVDIPSVFVWVMFCFVCIRVTEEHFWRNYFYRVSLIKQSAQLSSLAQQTGACLY